MIEKLKITFAAGETREIGIVGQYFEILESIYPVDVKLLKRDGPVIGGITGAETSFFTRTLGFETIQITSQYAQTVSFIVGNGEAGTRRVSGVVNVIDGGKEIIKSQRGFSTWGSAYVNRTQFDASTRPVVTLNNLYTNRILVVEKTLVSGLPALSETEMSGNSQGMSVFMKWLKTEEIAMMTEKQEIPINKIATGGTSEARLKTGVLNNAWMTAYLAGNVMIDYRMKHSGMQFAEMQTIEFSKPMIITPGAALAIVGSYNTLAVSATFDFYEEII